MTDVSQPKVSIVTVAYNQEQYIEEALASFVSQKTTFPFEVIVADDCSTDGTAKIIERYAAKYPDIIRPIIRTQNIGAVRNFISAMQAAKGTYIALCEGDDYWTDTGKLQTQADFLDDKPDYAVCFHPVRVFFEGDIQEDYVFPVVTDIPSLDIAGLLNRNYIQTNSVMYRKQKYNDLPDDVLPLDWYLHLYHAKFGKIGYIDRVMADYRRHPGGVWWSEDEDNYSIWKKHGVAHLRLYEEVLKLYGRKKEYRNAVSGLIINLFDTLSSIDRKHNDNLILQAISVFPAGAVIYFQDLRKRVDGLKGHSDKQAEIIAHFERRIAELEQQVQGQVKIIEKVTSENRRLQSKILLRLEGALKSRIAKVARKAHK